jgi:hypothetical protein
MLIEQDDVLGPHLRYEAFTDRWPKRQVKVLSERVLLQKRIHARKG